MCRTASCTSSPGRQPLLIFHQPTDYWYKPAGPAAGLLDAISSTSSPSPTGLGTPPPARRSEPDGLHRRSVSRAVRAGVSAPSTRPLMRRLDFPRATKLPYELDCLREASRLGAWPCGRTRGLPRRRVGFEIELGFSARVRTARAGASLQPHHRPQRSRRRAALSGAGEVTAGDNGARCSSTPGRSLPATRATSRAPTPSATPTSPR